MKKLLIKSTANPNQTELSHGKGGFDPRGKAVFNPMTGNYDIPVRIKPECKRPSADVVSIKSTKLREAR